MGRHPQLRSIVNEMAAKRREMNLHAPETAEQTADADG